MEHSTERWLRGPVERVPALLQPAAHALLQAVDDVKRVMHLFPDELLWQRPAGLASPGFHLRHLAGVLDRMGSYASGNPLTEQQFEYLETEGKETPVHSQQLVKKFEEQVRLMLQQLEQTAEHTLTDFRTVGRSKLPSTVIGILFHAAEHTQRHVGQLLVTVKMLISLSTQ